MTLAIRGRSAPTLAGMARVLLYVGLFLASLLTFRVFGLTIGDLALIASVVLLVMSGPSREHRPVDPWVWIAAALILVGAVLACYRADSGGGTLLVAVRVIYLVSVLPWQIGRLADTSERFKRATGWFVSGGVLCAAGAIFQYEGFIPAGTEITNAGRYTGFTQHVSDLGGVACVAAAFLLGGVIGRASRRRWLLLGLIVTAVGLFLSGSVSGLLAVTVALVFLILRGNFRFATLVLAALAATAALDLGSRFQQSTSHALSPFERVRQVFGASGADLGNAALNTSATRWATDQTGWDYFIHSPLLGRGMDQNSAIVDPYATLAVHNLVIGALHDGGLLVGIGILIPVLRGFCHVIRMRRADQFGMQLVVMFVAAFTFAMTGPSIYNRYFWVPVALLAAWRALGVPATVRAGAAARDGAGGSGRVTSPLVRRVGAGGP